MTKLTKEQVKFFIETMTDDMHNTTQHKIAETLLSKFDECESLQARLLAYEQAAKSSALWLRHEDENHAPDITTDPDVSREWISRGLRVTKLHTAPVLPKQPELIGMKVSIDTGGDNIGHRLFGEIVGTSDSKGVPVLCIEVAENNADVTLADEGEAAKIVKAAEKLVRCKGRYHSEQNYRAIAALFGVTVPDLPPLPSDEAPAQPVIPERPELRYGDNVLWFLNELAAFDASDIDSDDFDVYGEGRNGMEGCATISITELAADAAKLLSAQPAIKEHPSDNLPCPFCGGEVDVSGWRSSNGNSGPECNECGATASNLSDWNKRTAQPVSEPYKLNGWISVDSELPEEGARVLAFSDGAFVLMTEFTGGEFYDVVRNGGELFETVTRCVTHWMPLPAAPAQESE